jgi:hypothetical protein
MAAGLQPAVRITTQVETNHGTSRIRTHSSPRFELGRFAGLRIVPFHVLRSGPIRSDPAPPMGFEPTISTLTGWRALRAAPRGRSSTLRMAQEGFEPSASLGLNESGLPVAYRARQVTGSHRMSSDRADRSTQGGIRTHSRPGLSRVARPVGVPGLLHPAQCSRLSPIDAEAVGLEPTSSLRRHLFSRQAPDPAGWLPLIPFHRLSSGGWNRTSDLHVQCVASLPAATTPESSSSTTPIREGGVEPPPPDSKSGSLPVSRFPIH